MRVWFKATCTKCGHKSWWGGEPNHILNNERLAIDDFQKRGWTFSGYSNSDALCQFCTILDPYTRRLPCLDYIKAKLNV